MCHELILLGLCFFEEAVFVCGDVIVFVNLAMGNDFRLYELSFLGIELTEGESGSPIPNHFKC